MELIDLNHPDVAYIKSTTRVRRLIIWALGNTCTYKCSYCPSKFHNGSEKYHPIDVVKSVIKKLPQECHIRFTGGEPTYHPDFEKILSEIPDNFLVSLISNASRPYDFWTRVIDRLFSPILTYHVEFSNLDRFLKVAHLIFTEKKKPGLINLTMLPERWDDCLHAYKTFIEQNLPVNVKPLLQDFGNLSELANMKLIDRYTEEQIFWIQESTNENNYKPIVIYNNQKKEIGRTNPSELLANKQTNFYGWTCYNPTNFLNIHFNGDVYDSSCKQRRKMGNIYTDFKIPTEPVQCVTSFCWDHGGISTLKVKNISVNNTKI